jgi:hypothetical protein
MKSRRHPIKTEDVLFSGSRHMVANFGSNIKGYQETRASGTDGHTWPYSVRATAKTP